MTTVSVPLAFRWAGIAWPLASERVTLTLEQLPGPPCRITSEDGWTLQVVPDLPSPTKDQGPLAPVAGALRVAAQHAAPLLRSIVIGTSAVGRSRPGLAAALRVATRAALSANTSRTDLEGDLLDGAILLGEPRGGSAPVPDARLAWLSEHLLLFVDPNTPPPPIDHAIAGPDPRLVLEADPAAFFAALTGHGIPERPTWRMQRLDRDLRAAGLQARWPVEGVHHLALVHAGQREELRAALEAHGLSPATCRLGGPGVQVEKA